MSRDHGTDAPLDERTAMAVERTVMAADRSLMAWVRTGLSLITFGFTVYKFLDQTREQLQASGVVLSSVSSPRIIGLFLIGVGIVSLVLGALEHGVTLRVLRRRYVVDRRPYALFMAVVLTLFGLVLFLGILFQFKGIGTS
jgi:putative membrane protein